MLDPRRLLLLVDVVRAGSITAAAANLSYTTSAVSQQIAKLESEAGQPLLERHARGVRLTEAGAALARRAERIETQLVAARSELDDLAGLRAGTVRLGTFPTAGSSLLPRVVKIFKSRHPAVGFTVRSSRFAQLRAMLDAREIEMSLLWDYEWNPVADPELTVQPLLVRPTDACGIGAPPLREAQDDCDGRTRRRAMDHPRGHPPRRPGASAGLQRSGFQPDRGVRRQRLPGGAGNGRRRPRRLARASARVGESA